MSDLGLQNDRVRKWCHSSVPHRHCNQSIGHKSVGHQVTGSSPILHRKRSLSDSDIYINDAGLTTSLDQTYTYDRSTTLPHTTRARVRAHTLNNKGSLSAKHRQLLLDKAFVNCNKTVGTDNRYSTGSSSIRESSSDSESESRLPDLSLIVDSEGSTHSFMEAKTNRSKPETRGSGLQSETLNKQENVKPTGVPHSQQTTNAANGRTRRRSNDGTKGTSARGSPSPKYNSLSSFSYHDNEKHQSPFSMKTSSMPGEETQLFGEKLQDWSPKFKPINVECQKNSVFRQERALVHPQPRESTAGTSNDASKRSAAAVNQSNDIPTEDFQNDTLPSSSLNSIAMQRNLSDINESSISGFHSTIENLEIPLDITYSPHSRSTLEKTQTFPGRLNSVAEGSQGYCETKFSTKGHSDPRLGPYGSGLCKHRVKFNSSGFYRERPERPRNVSGWVPRPRGMKRSQSYSLNNTISRVEMMKSRGLKSSGTYSLDNGAKRMEETAFLVRPSFDTAYSYSSDSSEEGDGLLVDYPRRRLESFCYVERPRKSRIEETLVERDEYDEVFEENESENNPDSTGESSGTLKTFLSTTISGLYGICIIVCGTAIPLAERFSKPGYPFVFEAFYLFLYLIGIIFLIYVYLFVVRKRHFNARKLAKSIRQTLSFASSGRSSSTDSDKQDETPREPTKPLFSTGKHHHTGSFYLRLGAVVFGVGSMVQSGLHFGQYFQLFHNSSRCSNTVQAVKPFCHLMFTFIQLYFIFLNSKMRVQYYKVIARFGLMHLCTTNICVWIRVIVVETIVAINRLERPILSSRVHDVADTPPRTGNITGKAQVHVPTTTQVESLTSLECDEQTIMEGIVEMTGPYLYPCAIEYSIICAAILFVMWANVGDGNQTPETWYSRDSIARKLDELRKRNKSNSYDCKNSSRGLFGGILVSVGALVVMIAFYVLTSRDDDVYQQSAVTMVYLSETVMYMLTLGAVMIATHKMSCLRINSVWKIGMEESLLVFSFTGKAMFGVLSFIAAIYQTDSLYAIVVFVTNIFMMMEVIVQTIFCLAARRMYSTTKEVSVKKPGREFVTFLLLCNFSLFIINAFEIRKMEHNSLQLGFFGAMAWSIFTHVSVPLCILFRFHSFVYLCNIWKTAWKPKH